MAPTTKSGLHLAAAKCTQTDQVNLQQATPTLAAQKVSVCLPGPEAGRIVVAIRVGQQQGYSTERKLLAPAAAVAVRTDTTRESRVKARSLAGDKQTKRINNCFLSRQTSVQTFLDVDVVVAAAAASRTAAAAAATY